MGTRTAKVKVGGWRIFPFESEGSVQGSLIFIIERCVENNSSYSGETQTPPRPVGTERQAPCITHETKLEAVCNHFFVTILKCKAFP